MNTFALIAVRGQEAGDAPVRGEWRLGGSWLDAEGVLHFAAPGALSAEERRLWDQDPRLLEEFVCKAGRCGSATVSIAPGDPDVSHLRALLSAAPDGMVLELSGVWEPTERVFQFQGHLLAAGKAVAQLSRGVWGMTGWRAEFESEVCRGRAIGTAEGIFVEGQGVVFGVGPFPADAHINPDGSGVLASTTPLGLHDGITLAPLLIVRLGKGLTPTSLEAVGETQVTLGQRTTITVFRLVGDADRWNQGDAPWAIQAHALGSAGNSSTLGNMVEFTVRRLDDLTLERLAAELPRGLPSYLASVTRAVAEIPGMPADAVQALERQYRLGLDFSAQPGAGAAPGNANTVVTDMGKANAAKDDPRRLRLETVLKPLMDDWAHADVRIATPLVRQGGPEGLIRSQEAYVARMRELVLIPYGPTHAVLLQLWEIGGYRGDINTRTNPLTSGRPALDVKSRTVAVGVWIWDAVTDPAGAADAPPKAVTPRVRLVMGGKDLEPDAARLVRDAVQDGIQRHLPGAQWDGSRRHEEKSLAVRNATDTPLTVWVQAYSQRVAGKAVVWGWEPVGRDGLRAWKFPIPAQKSLILGEETAPNAGLGPPQVQAAFVRIWAESPAGDRWEEHRITPLPLVAPNPARRGARAYDSETVEVYTHTFAPLPPPGAENNNAPATNAGRQFAERLLSLRNDTEEPIKARVTYRSANQGVVRWRDAPPVDISPGETVTVRDADGARVRTAQVRIRGESNARKYESHTNTGLRLVPETNGRRAYAADNLGEFFYIFRPQRNIKTNANANANAQPAKPNTTAPTSNTPASTAPARDRAASTGGSTP